MNPRYSVILCNQSITEYKCQINNWLHQGIKVIWLGKSEDVQQYKKDFAVLMATLELASLQRTKEIEESDIEESKEEKHSKTGFSDVVKMIFSSKYARYAGRAAAVVAISVVSTAITASTLQAH